MKSSKSKSKSSKVQKSSKSANNLFDSNGDKEIIGGSSNRDGWDGSVSDLSFINTMQGNSGTSHWEKESWACMLTIAISVCTSLF